MQHGRARLQMRAYRSCGARPGTPSPAAQRDSRRQRHRSRRFAARGDRRVGAQRDREVCDDAEGMVDIQSLEHSICRASGTKFLGGPAIQRGPMRTSCNLELSECRFRATGDDRCVLTERFDHRAGELIALADAGAERWMALLERLLGDVGELLELGHELDEGTVLARWAGRSHARCGRTRSLTAGHRGIGRPARGQRAVRRSDIFATPPTRSATAMHASASRCRSDACSNHGQKKTPASVDTTAGDRPSGQPGRNRRNRRSDYDGEDEGKEQRGLRRSDVATENAGEREREADEEHHDCGSCGAE